MKRGEILLSTEAVVMEDIVNIIKKRSCRDKGYKGSREERGEEFKIWKKVVAKKRQDNYFNYRTNNNSCMKTTPNSSSKRCL